MSKRLPITLLSLPPELLLLLLPHFTDVRHLCSLALTCRRLHAITAPFLLKTKHHIESISGPPYLQYPARPPLTDNYFLNHDPDALLAWGDPAVCAALARLESEPLAASAVRRLSLPLLGEDEAYETAYNHALGYVSDEEDEDWAETWNEEQLARYQNDYWAGETMVDELGTRHMKEEEYEKYHPKTVPHPPNTRITWFKGNRPHWHENGNHSPCLPGSLTRSLALVKLFPNVTSLRVGGEHGQSSYHMEALFCIFADQGNLPILRDFEVEAGRGADLGAARMVFVEMLMRRPRMRAINIAAIDPHELGAYDFAEGEWTSNLEELELGLASYNTEPVYRDLVTLISRCRSLTSLNLHALVRPGRRESTVNWGRVPLVRFYEDLLTTLLEKNTTTLQDLRISLGPDHIPFFITSSDEDDGTGFDLLHTLPSLSSFTSLKTLRLPLWALIAGPPITPDLSPGNIAPLTSRLPISLVKLEIAKWLGNSTVLYADSLHAEVMYEVLELVARWEKSQVYELLMWEPSSQSIRTLRLWQRGRGEGREDGESWWSEVAEKGQTPQDDVWARIPRRGDSEKDEDEEGTKTVGRMRWMDFLCGRRNV